MLGLDFLDTLFIAWAFFYILVLITHFALRKRLFQSYTLKYGWIVYALGITAAVISLLLLLNGKSWYFWLGGFLCLLYSAFGYWVDYVRKIEWRKPVVTGILIPYVTLYLATLMFYWWPLYRLYLPFWIIYTVLYIIAMVLNIRSH